MREDHQIVPKERHNTIPSKVQVQHSHRCFIGVHAATTLDERFTLVRKAISDSFLKNEHQSVSPSHVDNQPVVYLIKYGSYNWYNIYFCSILKPFSVFLQGTCDRWSVMRA